MASTFIDSGMTGKGMKIGVIDGGFLDADSTPLIEHLLQRNRIRAYRDFLYPKAEPYQGNKYQDDGHGTTVLKQIAGYDLGQNILHGLAKDASFYLARTDHGVLESRKEERCLLKALEWMDSLGVKLINISLGYTNGFDQTTDDYSKDQIDGRSTWITHQINKFLENRDMLLVLSAGNDGLTDWSTLSAPADAQKVLAIGATGFKVWRKTDFSSIGPMNLPYLKPNLACYAQSGTSFSAPVVTALAACIWSKHPDLTSIELKTILEKSGHLYPFGNTFVGYGVPQCDRILEIISKESTNSATPIPIRKKYIVNNELCSSAYWVIFHKTDSIHVKYQEVISPKHHKFRVKRPSKHIKFSTIASDKSVVEIQWKP